MQFFQQPFYQAWNGIIVYILFPNPEIAFRKCRLFRGLPQQEVSKQHAVGQHMLDVTGKRSAIGN